MTRLVIFGNGEIAELAHYYFSTDSAYLVEGFTVDAEFLETESFCGLPLVPFEAVPVPSAPSPVGSRQRSGRWPARGIPAPLVQELMHVEVAVGRGASEGFCTVVPISLAWFF